MFSQKDIFLQLENMGAPKDKKVIVHTSLRAVGEVEGRGQGLLDVLIKYFTEQGGILYVPTHTWSNIFGEIVLDQNSPKTCVGTLPDIAAADKRGLRTSNPTHSLSIFGDRGKVEEIVSLEDKVNTPTSPQGAYGKLYEGGYVLLIGVGHNKNTYLHCVEEMLNVPNRLSKEPIVMRVKNREGRITDRLFYYIRAEGIPDVSASYPKYEPAFRCHGAITDGFIGNAPAQLCDAKIMADVVRLVRERSGGVELMADQSPLDESWYK